MSTISRLRPGDRVALLSASSAVPEDRLQPAVEAVRALGLEPVVYPSAYYVNHHGDAAATDAQRACDLQEAFCDPDIQGVLALRGGYRAARLLPMLDWRAILAHPKYFSGYSDVTALHMVFQNAGLVTHHTVMPATQYYKPMDDYSMAQLRRSLFGELTGSLPFPEGWQAQTLTPGVAVGPLVGGNLSLVAGSLGTPWELDTAGKILFLEDVDESPCRVDSLLTHLRNAGKLADCAGVALGYWTRCVAGRDEGERYLDLDEIFDELLGGLGKPVLKNIPCGHDLPSLALPLGATVRLDATARTLEVIG